jgi:DNA adenine methylase
MMRVNLECLDFREVIRKYDSESTFFFVDSPYHYRERHYKGGFTELDHIELSDMLGQIKGKCLVSRYRTPLIDRLYKGWNQHEVFGNVVGNYVTSGSRRRETEVYFTNYIA